MAGSSNSVYEFDSMVRGQYIYTNAWAPFIHWQNSQVHPALQEDNEHDKYAVNDRL